MKFIKRYIGDRRFYRMLLMVALPIIVQNGITNFVSLIDNIMIGSIGTEQMTGVSIVNQLFMVFNITIFGLVSGAGIFGAQYYGKGDEEGIRYTFRFKMISCILFSVFAIALFWFLGEGLISLFLHEGSEGIDLDATLYFGKQYLAIMLIQFIPNAITQAYSSTLRERGQTVVPMVAGVTAVFINVVLNTVLIFGLLGFPKLGVAGAAIATCIAKTIETIIVIVWTHTHSKEYEFINGAYRSLYIPRQLIGQIVVKGAPLMMNEMMWSLGMTFLVQIYSTRGAAVVTSQNIANTLMNFYNVIFISIGSAISIIVGQLLGAGKMEEAVDTNRKLTFTAVFSSAILGVVVIFVAPYFPLIYNTTDEVRSMSTSFLQIAGLFIPLWAFVNSAYFTLRTGGKTFVTFLFDSVFVWVVTIPAAYFLTGFSGLGIVLIYFICQALDLIKAVIGYVLLKSKIWVVNMVAGR